MAVISELISLPAKSLFGKARAPNAGFSIFAGMFLGRLRAAGCRDLCFDEGVDFLAIPGAQARSVRDPEIFRKPASRIPL
jgi:hypothetical protein